MEHVLSGGVHGGEELTLAMGFLGREVTQLGVPTRHEEKRERQATGLVRHSQHEDVVVPHDVRRVEGARPVADETVLTPCATAGGLTLDRRL
ncbi:hypothetical protein [Serinicoccus marinus]|uniref:hypothetical protein n=1 Tax=Serinicoccus marinus TaxID=247333 RepID=UPI001375BE76|nr:hypothetical protein [Serinicoccus marinus]